MVRTLGSFFALYLATLVLLLGAGLFNTYLGLRLTAASVSEVWIGGLIAIYYLGLVFGARVGHKLIQRVVGTAWRVDRVHAYYRVWQCMMQYTCGAMWIIVVQRLRCFATLCLTGRLRA